MEAEKKDKAAGLAGNPTLPYLLGCGCLGLILFAIAVTIVMALIPTYLPSKADGLSRTNYTSMIAQMQAEAGTATAGRKRSTGLESYVGYQFGESGRDQLRQIIVQSINLPQVKDLRILSVTIANRADSKKKRMALDRDTRQLSTVIYDISMMFLFSDACPYACQTKTGASIQQLLYNISPDSLVFNNVILWMDGASSVNMQQLRTKRVSFVSSILSAFSPFRPGAGPATRSVTGSVSG